MARPGKKSKLRKWTLILRLAMVFFVTAVLLCLHAISRQQYIYSFVDGSRVTTHQTYEADPAAAMAEAGITLDYGDTYTMTGEGGLRTVELRRSIRVTIIVDGNTIILSTTGQCVRDALAQAGVDHDDDDILSCAPGDLLTDGMTIELTRMRTVYSSYRIMSRCQVIYVENPAELDGVSNVIVPGQSGIDCVIYKDTYVGGVLTSRVKCCRYTVVEASDRVIELGTGTAAQPHITLADGRARLLPEVEQTQSTTPVAANNADWSGSGDEGDPNAR